MRVTPLAAVAAVPDGAALSVVGVITRVGPVLRSAAYDVDFDAAAPQPSFGSADGDGAPAGGGGGGARRAGDADVDAVARLMSKLSGPGALGRGAGGTVWSMHRFVWLRDGSGDGPDVAVKVFPNSRVAAFSRCVVTCRGTVPLGVRGCDRDAAPTVYLRPTRAPQPRP